VNALAFWIGFRALGIDVPYSAANFLQGIIAIGVAPPSSPGFFGVFEAAAKVGLEVYGVPGGQAVSWAIGFHIPSFIPITLIGLYYFARLGLHFSDSRRSLTKRDERHGRPRPSCGEDRPHRRAGEGQSLLRVLAREASGYHQLETLFCRLELGDAVTIRTDVRGRSFDCTGDVIPPAGLGVTERNLAWRAAVAYTDATGWPNEWAIEIVKTIPVGGGLGGGSADAGAVLRCLNALAPSPLAVHELLALAGPLGADVPFLCIDDPLALAWGRGERMLALPPLPSRAVTLVCFPFGVSTPDAYGWLDAAEGVTRSRSASMSVDALTTGGRSDDRA
jgi:hypothetical protein